MIVVRAVTFPYRVFRKRYGPWFWPGFVVMLSPYWIVPIVKHLTHQ